MTPTVEAVAAREQAIRHMTTRQRFPSQPFRVAEKAGWIERVPVWMLTSTGRAALGKEVFDA